MTTSDLWRSWPPRPTSRGLTVHLLNQHLCAASLWHSNISLTQALHIITLATTPSRLLSLSIVTTILDMGPSHSIVLDKMFLGVDMQIRCRLSTWESSMHHYLSNESATHPSWNSYRCHDLSIGYHLYGQTFYQHWHDMGRWTSPSIKITVPSRASNCKRLAHVDGNLYKGHRQWLIPILSIRGMA